jgi:hypothetical protein
MIQLLFILIDPTIYMVSRFSFRVNLPEAAIP